MTKPTRQDDSPADPETVAKAFFAAGKSALSEGRAAEAAATLRAALDLCDSTPGLGKLSLEILERLALAVHRSSGPAAALPLQRRVISLYEASDPDNPCIPALRATAALFCAQVGRDEEAAEHIARVVAWAKDGDGEDPVIVAASTMIGDLLARQGEFPEAAETLLQIARHGLIAAEGAESPEAASIAVLLASYAMRDDRDEEALELLEASLPVLEAQEPRPARLGEGLMYLGQLRVGDERYEEAEALFTKGEATYRAIGPSCALQALGCAFQRALVYRKQGRAAEAEPLFVQALEGVSGALGEEHAAAANIVGEYVEMLESLGRTEEAEALKGRFAGALAAAREEEEDEEEEG